MRMYIESSFGQYKSDHFHPKENCTCKTISLQAKCLGYMAVEWFYLKVNSIAMSIEGLNFPYTSVLFY